MSYTSFDFPHTHYYDSDLREVLAKLKLLLDDYNKLVNGLAELNEWKFEHEGDYEELLVRLSTVEGEICRVRSKCRSSIAPTTSRGR